MHRLKDDIESFVRGIYLGILRREPDSAGAAHWSQALEQGLSPSQLVTAFLQSAEFQAQSPEMLFVPPGHFYSPIVNSFEAERHLASVSRNAEQIPGVKIDRHSIVETWRQLTPLMQSAPFGAERKNDLLYYFNNPAYSWGDGSVLHAMIRYFRPKKIIEIGSGYSSACMIDTVSHYLTGHCSLLFIEPFPKLLHDLIGNRAASVEILEKPVQDVDVGTFECLQENDILFIDSTHVMRTGSDVCYELFEILPRLRPGVLVHIHDMFWPFEYPRNWIVNENRSWNELYAVRAFLTENPCWKTIMFNDYLLALERARIEQTYPNFLRNSGGALWLQRISVL